MSSQGTYLSEEILVKIVDNVNKAGMIWEDNFESSLSFAPLQRKILNLVDPK